jgi:hypothetical protein
MYEGLRERLWLQREDSENRASQPLRISSAAEAVADRGVPLDEHSENEPLYEDRPQRARPLDAAFRDYRSERVG